MGEQRNFELEQHIRGMVRAVAAFSNKKVEILQEELADEIGISQSTFEGFYYSRGRIDERVIRVLLKCAAGCRNIDRAWGERLLKLTGFDSNAELKAYVNQRWPSAPGGAPVPIPRSSTNLPSPSYGQFIMRSTAFAELREALAGRTAMVALLGMGGIGKTSLAREIAGRCLIPSEGDREAGLPAFDIVCWVSDKDRPGDTRLNTVLNEIADLHIGGALRDYALIAKQREVDKLLRAQRILLVLDNVETITDPALIAWLPTIPEPSKVLLTMREARPALQARGIWHVELKRMTEQEGRDFILLHSKQRGMPVPSEPTQRKLLSTLGGNPKALEIVLGLMKPGRSVEEVLPGKGSDPTRELADLVAASWATLSNVERQIAQALTMFPGSVADSALAQVAGVDLATYYDAIRQLSDLSLVETEHWPDSTVAPIRRALHPVTRQFIEAGLNEAGLFVAEAHARRVAWAVEYALAYGGHRPNEPEALAHIEAEEPALWAILKWASNLGFNRETLILARQLEFYYYTRVLWDRNRDLYERAIRAARGLGETAALIDMLALLVQLASRQGRPQQAQEELAELIALSHRESLQGEQFFRAHHAQALAWMALGQLDAAAATWQSILGHDTEQNLSARLITGTRYWLGICRHRQGKLSEAMALLEQSLAEAQAQRNTRRVARTHIALAHVALDRGELDKAESQLTAAAQLDLQPDDEQHAHYLNTRGRLYLARSNAVTARQAILEALRLFERMGLEPEMREAEALLTSLEGAADE